MSTCPARSAALFVLLVGGSCAGYSTELAESDVGLDCADDDLDCHLADTLLQAARDNVPKEYAEIGWDREGLAFFTMPHRDDVCGDFGCGGLSQRDREEAFLAALPQDRERNELTPEKVELGMLLFHEPGMGTNPTTPENFGTYSCSACHNAAAGFKPGIRQGLGEGGEGFGTAGRARHIPADTSAEEVDFQDRSPLATINGAWQKRKLWSFSNGGGIGNLGDVDFGDAMSLALALANQEGYQGLETQGLGGFTIHRQNAFRDMDGRGKYEELLAVADEGIDDDLFSLLLEKNLLGRDELYKVGFAVAAYQRALLTNEAPFQRWLRNVQNTEILGDPTRASNAMSDLEKEGAIVFFGKADCVRCHTGPALDHPEPFRVGFRDLYETDWLSPEDAWRFESAPDKLKEAPETWKIVNDERPEHFAEGDRGVGQFTGDPADDFLFQSPTLYNLTDASIMGHGASFFSVRDVVEYFDAAIPETRFLAERPDLELHMEPLGLSEREIQALTAFLETGLRDKDLQRYAPPLPTHHCPIVADPISLEEPRCAGVTPPGQRPE